MAKRTGPNHVYIAAPERPRRFLWLLATAAVALVAAALAIYYSPSFRIQQVETITPPGLDGAQLEAVAGLRGQSLFTASLAAAEARLEELPVVKSAQAQRHWPRTVQILITTRTPWGYWQVGDATYVIDIEGVVLSVQDNIGAAPAIRQTDGGSGLAPGARVDADAVAVAQRLSEALPQQLGLGVVYFEYNRAEGLSVATDAGYRVVVGDGHALQYKLAVWQAVEAEVGRERLQGQSLDLRYGDRPSLRRQ
ncbi:MAG: cell division protein FtsQ/DivIB [Dehalococcoidia bacterium]